MSDRPRTPVDLDGILHQEVVRRAAGVPDFIEHHAAILRDDLDANTRALAVALGIWKEPWPTGESAPRLMYYCRTWELYTACGGYDSTYTFVQPEDAPTDPVGAVEVDYMVIDLEAFIRQVQALDVCRAIWAMLKERQE